MFQGRPISLKVEVWDRIKTYMDDQAGKDRNYQPNTSAMIEEADALLNLVRRERIHCFCTRTNTEVILIDDSGVSQEHGAPA